MSHFLVTKVQFGTVVLSDSVDSFLLKPTVDVDTGALQNCFFHLVKIVWMQSPYPIFAEYLQFFNFSAALLLQEERKEFCIDVDDGCMDGG